MYLVRLLGEATTVAAVTALALTFALWLAGPITTVSKALIVGAVAGAAIHLAFELGGANRYYCGAGAACGLR